MANGSLTGADAGHALVGAATGAAIGSVVPGVGTAVGAAIGGVVGGLTGLLGGGPTAQQHAANVGGQSIDARKIWEQIHPGNSSPLHEGATAASALRDIHQQRVDEINELNRTMDAAWQGDSSATAQAGAHPLAIWLQDSASNLQNSAKYLTNQGESFDTAHNKVQQIAAKPPTEGFLDSVNPFSDKDDEINKYNQQGQANVDAFNAYYQASAQNAAGMPQFKAWTGNNIADGHTGGDGPGTGSTGGGGGGGYSGGGGSSAAGSHLPGYGANMPSSHLPSTTGSGGHTPTTLPTNLPGSGSGGYNPSWNDSTAAAGYTPASTDYSSGFGPGGSSGFGPGGSGGGAGAGAGSGGFGGVAGFGPSGSGSLGAGSSTGAGAGSGGSGGGTGAGGFRGGATGAAGRAGMSGMGGMGHGAKGKGEDDEEHETKYLISEDPNELFGTDQLTAPPVIGE